VSRLLLVILLVAAIASAVAVVHKRHQHRQLFVQLSRLEHQRDELNIELEQATLTQAGRVDQLARTRIGMKFPEAADIVVVRQ
jgi:cell division protein FtsL